MGDSLCAFHLAHGEVQEMNRWLKGLLETGNLFANIIAFCLIGVLIINFIYGPWPSVSWNPLWDVLYVRSGGPLLYANHVSVELAMCFIAGYFMLRNRKDAWKWMVVIFSTASLHELILSVVSYPVTQSVLYLIFNPLTYRWIFWLALTLGISLVVSDSWQRKKLWQITILVACIEIIWVIAIVVIPFNPRSIIQYGPGPALLSFPENFFEVASWLIPLAWWFRGLAPAWQRRFYE